MNEELSWDESSSDRKMELTRDQVLTLLSRVNELEAKVRGLERHHHGDGKKAVISIEESSCLRNF